MNRDVVIVTGASSGIGAATARLLAGPGSALVLHARKSASLLEQVAAEARQKGSEVVTLLADLTDDDLGERLVNTAVEAFGQLDGVVANAGFPIIKSFEQGSLADLDYAFKGNAGSFLSLVKSAAPHLARAARGRIVAVGSFTAHVFRTDIRLFPMSAASKGALEVAVKCLAVELAGKGIRVNCVVPGFVKKDSMEDSVSDEELAQMCRLIPLGRPGRSEDIAGAIGFLLSPAAGYVTGQVLHVNGGLHV